jgi:hypothetical protein
VSVEWNGDSVAERVRRASLIGVNRTMGKCIVTAKELVHVDTSTLQGSIRSEPARETASGATGTWGSFDVNYALWQEVLPSERGGKAYLRPAADTHYRELGNEIRGALL